jgi:hypothetical protein
VPDRRSSDTAYAAWLRFCALWHFNYTRAFGIDRPAGVRDEAWFRKHVGDAEPNGMVRELDDYVATALRYAAAMAKFSTWDRGSFNLWADWPIAAVDETHPSAEPDLNGGKLSGGLGDFVRLIHGLEELQDAADIYWAMAKKPSPSSRGLRPFVALLHECSAP